MFETPGLNLEQMNLCCGLSKRNEIQKNRKQNTAAVYLTLFQILSLASIFNAHTQRETGENVFQHFKETFFPEKIKFRASKENLH